jgi:hypothetical protein
VTPAARAKCWHMRDSSDESHETRGQPSNRDTSEIVGLMLTGPRITVLDANGQAHAIVQSLIAIHPNLKERKLGRRSLRWYRAQPGRLRRALHLMHTTEASMIRGALELNTSNVQRTN